jgi:aconitase B
MIDKGMDNAKPLKGLIAIANKRIAELNQVKSQL